MNQGRITPGDDARAEDVAVARLAAQDPAVGAQPDAEALRAAVDRRVAASAGRPDRVADARRRRWTSWPARVAGAAAAALVIGAGGGYAIGDAGREPAAVAGTTTEATVEGGGDIGGGAPAAPRPAGPAPGVATESMPADARASSFAPYGGRTVFRSEGLAQEGGVAPAWGFDPGQTFTAETVAAVAAALGIAGAPEERDGMWVVGPTDGTGPSVSLNADATGSLSFWDPSSDPWSCLPEVEPPVLEGGPEAGAAGDGGEVAGGSVGSACGPRDVGAPPAFEAAVEQLRGVMAAAGTDPDRYEFVADADYSGGTLTSVSAYGVVDGVRTGLMWSASSTGAGLQSLYGTVAPLVELGEYEVISPAAAVERLTDPRFGAGTWGGPIAFAGEGRAMLEEVVPGVGDLSTTPEMPVVPTLPPAPEPGAAVLWPVAEVTIVEARLGAAVHYGPDGSARLLPTYELADAEGSAWTVIALAEQHLDFSAP